MSKVLSRFQSRKEDKIQSRSWQLVVPEGWDNLDSIKDRCRGIAQNYYFIVHCNDKNELGEPVKPHWHLLMSFATARRLDTMENYFKEWGNFDKEKNCRKEDSKGGESGEVEIGKSADLENAQLLRSNSFERVYSIKGAKKYLVHAEHPNKHQYSPLEVETNDRLFMDLFLPSPDKISNTRKIIGSFKQLAECSTFGEFLSLFEEHMYAMPNSQQISHVINLRKYYNEYRNSLDFYKNDGFDKVLPKNDGFYPVGEKFKWEIDLPF
jgi:hypothetical protein